MTTFDKDENIIPNYEEQNDIPKIINLKAISNFVVHKTFENNNIRKI